MRHLQGARSAVGYTPVDRFSRIGEEQKYLGQRCHELWKIIRLLMKEKRYLDWTGVSGRNPNPKHIGEDTAGTTQP
jgi:hypothetical protein